MGRWLGRPFRGGSVSPPTSPRVWRSRRSSRRGLRASRVARGRSGARGRSVSTSPAISSTVHSVEHKSAECYAQVRKLQQSPNRVFVEFPRRVTCDDGQNPGSLETDPPGPDPHSAARAYGRVARRSSGPPPCAPRAARLRTYLRGAMVSHARQHFCASCRAGEHMIGSHHWNTNVAILMREFCVCQHCDCGWTRTWVELPHRSPQIV